MPRVENTDEVFDTKYYSRDTRRARRDRAVILAPARRAPTELKAIEGAARALAWARQGQEARSRCQMAAACNFIKNFEIASSALLPGYLAKRHVRDAPRIGGGHQGAARLRSSLSARTAGCATQRDPGATCTARTLFTRSGRALSDCDAAGERAGRSGRSDATTVVTPSSAPSSCREIARVARRRNARRHLALSGQSRPSRVAQRGLVAAEARAAAGCAKISGRTTRWRRGEIKRDNGWSRPRNRPFPGPTARPRNGR